MSKFILKTVSTTLLLLSTIVSAQDFQGKAYYQTQRKVNMKMEGSQMPEEEQQKMQEMLKKQFEKTYILTFNKEASIYKEEVQLDKPEAPGNDNGGMRVMIIGEGADQKRYKNTKTKTYADEQDVFGKAFLVKDELETFKWVLGEKSKIIGKYLCFNATATREIESTTMNFNSDDHDKSSEEIKKEMKTQTIIAWYTTDIPISNGPDEFWGLPGLILELHDGNNMQYVCTKIVLNSKNKTEISAPTKGKVVNQEEFEEIMEKKMQEMNKQFEGRERKGEVHRMQIKIGG